MTKAPVLNDDQKRQLIAKAIRDMAPEDTDGWDSLSALSGNTQVETVEVFEDEISISGDKFLGPIVWHVDLIYRDPDGDIHQSDSYPGTVSGQVRGKDVVIEHMTADTRAFYA